VKIRLRYRIAAITLACLLAIVTLSLLALVRLASGYLWDEAERDAVRLAETVRRSTHRSMLLADPRRVEETLLMISGIQGVEAIRVYDLEGRLKLPSTAGAAHIAYASECTGCHPDPRRSPPAHSGNCSHWQGDTLRVYYPIPNEPACGGSSCHGPPASERILGVLEVAMDTSATRLRVRELRIQGLFWGTVVLLAAALPLLFGFGQAIERPLADSLQLVREVARGNLRIRSGSRRSDEWGELLRTFDSMVAALEEARTELEALNRSLEEQIADRTRELREALEAARESDVMKTRFLANVSHEFSTPLQSIIGYSELLLDGIDGEISPPQRADIARILRSGRELLELVEDLLELARVDGHRRQLSLDLIRLNDLALGAFCRARRAAEGKPIEVSFEEDPACPPVLADTSALRRVLLHLVENAVRYTASGRVVIRVGPTPEGAASVTVEDDGPGVDPDVLEAALTGVSVKGGGGGLSVGLSLAKRLVELHGGTFEVRSTPGKGTAVFVGLPPAPGEQAEGGS
jgi:signal transduction histidine kinase